MNRGEIWWASLPEPVGSEPGYHRPVIVVQANTFNRSRIATVIAVVVTSNLRLADAPGNVLLPMSATGLSQNSVANASQILTIDKDFLTEYIGRLPLDLLLQLESGLRLVLDL
jgi:mRNA interferase MazF